MRRMLVHVFRAGGVISLSVIVVASLVPGELRPHSSLPGDLEHVVTYAAAGFGLSFLFSEASEGTVLAFGLFLLACALEILQLEIPGRRADTITAILSGMAGGCGVKTARGVMARWPWLLP